jgi:hypothetical protein
MVHISNTMIAYFQHGAMELEAIAASLYSFYAGSPIESR